MQRRTFMYLSSVTAMALTLPVLSGCGMTDSEKALAQPLFFSHLADKSTIVEAGKVYRKAVPQEDDRQKLSDLLLKGDRLTTASDPRIISSALDKQVAEDFRQGRTLTLKGWVLALTEARQCALFSLVHA